MLCVVDDGLDLLAFKSVFLVCLLAVVVEAVALAKGKESGCSFSTISLATRLRSMNEKFRLKFKVGGGPGVLATLSGYSVSFPHLVTAKRICFP